MWLRPLLLVVLLARFADSQVPDTTLLVGIRRLPYDQRVAAYKRLSLAATTSEQAGRRVLAFVENCATEVVSWLACRDQLLLLLILPAALQPLFSHKSPEVREEALALLGRVRPPRLAAPAQRHAHRA